MIIAWTSLLRVDLPNPAPLERADLVELHGPVDHRHLCTQALAMLLIIQFVTSYHMNNSSCSTVCYSIYYDVFTPGSYFKTPHLDILQRHAFPSYIRLGGLGQLLHSGCCTCATSVKRSGNLQEDDCCYSVSTAQNLACFTWLGANNLEGRWSRRHYGGCKLFSQSLQWILLDSYLIIRSKLFLMPRFMTLPSWSTGTQSEAELGINHLARIRKLETLIQLKWVQIGYAELHFNG